MKYEYREAMIESELVDDDGADEIQVVENIPANAVFIGVNNRNYKSYVQYLIPME